MEMEKQISGKQILGPFRMRQKDTEWTLISLTCQNFPHSTSPSSLLVVVVIAVAGPLAALTSLLKFLWAAGEEVKVSSEVF